MQLKIFGGYYENRKNQLGEKVLKNKVKGKDGKLLMIMNISY